MLTVFRKANFEPLVNQKFVIRPDQAMSISVTLTSIAVNTVSTQYESFSLNFYPIDDAAALPDGSYLFENEQLGQAIIFISATHAGSPDPNKYYYEAVFNVYVGADVK